MHIKRFLQLGVVGVMAAVSLANAIAQPVGILLENPQLNETEIVQTIKNNISKNDLTYLIKKPISETTERSEVLYNKIQNLITVKYGTSHLNKVKTELNETLKQLGPDIDNVKVTYGFAMPKEIIDEVAKENPGTKENDTSSANNALNISKECSIQVNLAVDNKGRLFEASELVSLSREQVSNMSQQEIMGVLKEAVLHEASHCALHTQLKDPNFSLKFSKSYQAQNPAIVKQLNEKLADVIKKISNNQNENINILDYMTLTNYHESYADVNAAFARLGEHPTAETIKQAKEQLLNVSRLREHTDFNHKTQYAVQYALAKMDDAAKMNPTQRVEFTKEIASDSLMNSMRIVLSKGFGRADTETFGNYMVGGIHMNKDGTATYEVPSNKIEEYKNITKEIEFMREQDPIMGTMSQRMRTYKGLMEEYSTQISKNTENQNEEKPRPNPTYAFNFNAYMSIRENSLKQSSELDSRKKLKA